MRMVSYSEVSTFRACPLKWHLRYQVGLKSPERIAKLDLGLAWHKVLEVYYGAQIGVSVDDIDARQAAAEKKARFTIANIRSILPGQVYEKEPEDLLQWMFDGYLVMWKERDREWEVIECEYHITAPLGLRTHDETVRFHGFIDVIQRSRKTGRIRARDYKSSSQRDLSAQSWAKELQLDDQFGLYNKALLLEGRDIDFIEYDGARTDRLKREMTLTERFNRVALYRSPGELDVLWEEFRNAVRDMLATERGSRPVTSNPNPAECRWKCDLMNAHLLGRMNGGDYVGAAESYGFVSRADRAFAAEAGPLGVTSVAADF